jgi:hypothetical protein
MIVDLIIWLGVVGAAFVAWSLYATAAEPISSDELEPLPVRED